MGRKTCKYPDRAARHQESSCANEAHEEIDKVEQQPSSNYFYQSKSNRANGRQSLAELDLPQLADFNARNILVELPPKHLNEKNHLRESYENSFFTWLFELRQGFSLVFYGFGSKRQLLDKFARDVLLDGGVLSVNGFAVGLTGRQVLVKAAGMLLQSTTQQLRSLRDEELLRKLQAEKIDRVLYVVVHNVDGLRDAASQAVLSELAACANIHFLASVDHMNAPLLWDKQTASRFNWLWHDVTNYVPYVTETLHIQSLLVERSEERAMAGGSLVLRTLVPNAREVFRTIAKHQLGVEGEPGVTFEQLFRECRERFLVQNELTLRSHLSQFRDHQLVTTRRGQDGSDLLVIPLEEQSLQIVLQEMEAMLH